MHFPTPSSPCSSPSPLTSAPGSLTAPAFAWQAWRNRHAPIAVVDALAQDNAGLTVCPRWLRRHERLLKPEHEALMARALDALTGAIPVLEINTDKYGGDFEFADLGSDGAHHVVYERDDTANQVTHIRVNRENGDTIAQLGRTQREEDKENLLLANAARAPSPLQRQWRERQESQVGRRPASPGPSTESERRAKRPADMAVQAPAKRPRLTEPPLSSAGFHLRRDRLFIDASGRAVEIQSSRQLHELRALPMVAQLSALEFTAAQIARVARNPGAARVLPAVIAHTGRLKELGFTNAQIAKIATHAGAAQALPALIAHAAQLHAFGFDIGQIARIAANVGGAQALPIVIKHTRQLETLGFSIYRIAKIADTAGAAQALPAVIAHAGQLHALGLDTGQITRIANTASGAQALAAMVAHVGQLKELGFDIGQIARIANTAGGAQALPAVIAHAPQLHALGFNIGQVAKIAGNDGSAQALPALIAHAGQLKELGFDISQIAKIAGHHGAAQALPALIAHAGQLKELGFDIDQIAKIAGNHGGTQALLAVIAHTGQLHALGFNIDQIARIASNDGAAQALPALIAHAAQLHTLGFDTEQITRITSHIGSKQTLAMVAAQPWQQVLEKADLLKLACRSSGSIYLAWYLDHHAALAQQGVSKDEMLKAAVSTKAARNAFLSDKKIPLP